MENNFDTIKKEHIIMLDQLILVLDNYKRYMETNIKQWDNIKSKELDSVNTQMDDLVETFFSLVCE